jgi:hypothetical protein
VTRFWPILFLLIWCPAVHAASFFLEISEHGSKAEAEQAVARYGPEGEGMRVSRRFVRGQGWRYVLRMDGFGDREVALQAANSFATGGQIVTVFEGTGYRRRVVDRVGAAPAVSPAAATPAPDDRFPTALSVLRRAVSAHGGRGGGVRRLAKLDGIQFSFDSRTVVGEGEWKIRHHFYRAGELARLEIDMLKGDGVSNTVVLGDGGKAWVATADLVRQRDSAQAAQTMARFAPETGVLAIPLGLAGDIKEAAEWQGLKTTGRVSHRGDQHLRLVPDIDGAGNGNPLEAALFDEASGRLSQVTWVTRGGRVTFIYGDYRAVAEDLVVPFSVRVERNGGMVEAIAVTDFVLNPTLSQALFVEPPKIKGRKH